jgi:hypothetical protein
VVRGTVEETLNALRDAEADRLCNAQRYERSDARRDTRAGHYESGLQAKAGEVRLRVPKLRRHTFETAIIERYRRRESSVEEALIEMYLAGCRCAGSRTSRRHYGGAVSDLNKKIYGTIEAWRNRPLEGEHPYVYLDGIVLKRSWAGEVRNVSLLVERERLSGDSRHLRGGEGGQDWLERVPQASQGTRAVRCTPIALEPVGAGKHADDRRDGRRLVDLDLHPDAQVLLGRQEVIDDVEAPLAGLASRPR